MTSAADNRGNRTQYTLDARGNLTCEKRKDARGNTTSYQYDALNRLTQVSQADGKVQTFSYDGDTAQTGRLRELSDSSGSTQYQRDAFGRIASKTQFIADDPGVASNYTTRYAYSGAGELSQISYPSGLKIYYRRNASGQITGIDSQQSGSDKPIVPFLSELTYTALGQPRSWHWASGDTATRRQGSSTPTVAWPATNSPATASTRPAESPPSRKACGPAQTAALSTKPPTPGWRATTGAAASPALPGPARRPATATTPTATA